MTDLTDVYAALQKADAAGDTAGAKQLADYIRTQSGGSGRSYDYTDSGPVPSGNPRAAYSPVAGNNWAQNFGLGYGESVYNIGQAIGQDVGLVSSQDVQNSRELSAPLNAAKGSGWGRAVGTGATLLPAAFIPGANTLGGAAAIGAGSSMLLQPTTSLGERAINTGVGAAGGAAGLLAGRLIAAGYQGIKGLVQPLFQGGQSRLAAQTLQTFAGGPQASADAATALQAPGTILPGVQPTTAELANNAGLAQLERQLRNNPEYMNALTSRNQANRAAMTGALGKIAGTDADMAAAVSARSAASNPLYSAAREAQIVPDATLKALLTRPSLSSAWNRAQSLASENGEALVVGRDIPATTTTHSMVTDFGSPYTTTTAGQSQTYSGRAIQYLKMALNDIANTGPQNGMGAHEINSVKSTLGSLNEWIQGNVPQLKAADAAYATGSTPINQMEVGRALSDRLLPSLADFGNNTRLNANSFATALRNGDQLAANATGWKGSTLEGVLSPAQMQTVTQVGQQLARRANADELGRAVGSNTSQNIISQSVLRQALGPLGLPESMAERAAQSTFGQSLLRPAQWATGAGMPRIMDRLAESALSPDKAAALLKQGANPAVARAIWERQGLAGTLGYTIGSYLTQ